MRKILLASVLLLGASMNAQVITHFEGKKVLQKANIQRAVTRTAQNQVVSFTPLKTSVVSAEKVAAVRERVAKVGELGYLGLCYASLFSSTPAFFEPVITQEGSTITFENFLPVADEGVKITGTISGDIVTIPSGQEITSLTLVSTGEEVQGVLSQINTNSLKEVTGNIMLQKVGDHYEYAPASAGDILVIKPEGMQGYLEGYSHLAIYPYDALDPIYASFGNLWHYGQAVTREAFTFPMGVAYPGYNIPWISLASAFETPSYTVDWAYTVDGTAATPQTQNGALVVPVPTSATTMSFPTATATCGSNVTTYNLVEDVLGSSDAASQLGESISVNTSSYVSDGTGSSIDLGFTAQRTWDGVLYLGLFGGRYTYPQTITVQGEDGSAEQVTINSVGTIYENMVPLRFSSIGVQAYVPGESFGQQITLTISEVTSDEQGYLRKGDDIATSTITLTSGTNFNQWIEVTGTTAGTGIGMIQFSNFQGFDEEGFTVPLETATTPANFMLTLSGASIDVVVDAKPNFLMALAGSDSKFLGTADGNLLTMGDSGVNMGIYFYDAYVDENAASISDIASNGQNINVINNGTGFELSYAEGIRGVQVVNVAGQVVADYALDGTSATIPASALAKGLYILKFDNGQTVKVMK